MGSSRNKSNIAIAIFEKLPLKRVPKIFSHFDGSNNIYADCIAKYMLKKKHTNYLFIHRITLFTCSFSNEFCWFKCVL